MSESLAGDGFVDGGMGEMSMPLREKIARTLCDVWGYEWCPGDCTCDLEDDECHCGRFDHIHEGCAPDTDQEAWGTGVPSKELFFRAADAALKVVADNNAASSWVE